jgi:hypothetical protein
MAQDIVMRSQENLRTVKRRCAVFYFLGSLEQLDGKSG